VTGHEFCRTLLVDVMKDVRERWTSEEIKAVWTWDDAGGRKHFVFHGPHGEYLYNLKLADCHWSAKAEGWQQLLKPQTRR
jgi:hypothetical protein